MKSFNLFPACMKSVRFSEAANSRRVFQKIIYGKTNLFHNFRTQLKTEWLEYFEILRQKNFRPMLLPSLFQYSDTTFST